MNGENKIMSNVICVCRNITEETIVSAIKNGATTLLVFIFNL